MNMNDYIADAPNRAPLMGCLAYARALMTGDPARYRAGYTADNAYIATVEQARRENVGLDEIALAGCLGIDRGRAIRLLGAVR